MNDFAPSMGDSSSAPLPEIKLSSQEQGLLGQHNISPKPFVEGSIPQEIASEIFSSLKGNDYHMASELMRQTKLFKENPSLFAEGVEELIIKTKAAINQKKSKYKSSNLLPAIEQIEFDWNKKNKNRNPLFIKRSASILKKVAFSEEKFNQLLEELALTSLPDSMKYVLESAWTTLIGEKKHIIFAGIAFVNSSFQTLLQVIKKNSSLNTLSFSACKVFFEGKKKRMGDEEINKITHACHKHQSLQKLFFTYHRLHKTGIQSVSKLFQSLSNLDLSGNSIQDSDIEILANKLASSNSLLEQLSLEMNNIQNEGFDKLSRALVKNQYLKYLSLWGNKIEGQSACEAVKALHKENSTLEKLNLGGNLIDQDTIAHFSSIERSRIFI